MDDLYSLVNADVEADVKVAAETDLIAAASAAVKAEKNGGVLCVFDVLVEQQLEYLLVQKR